MIASPQYNTSTPIVVALRPILKDFSLFAEIPPAFGIAIKRPELLPVMIDCLSRCTESDRDIWLAGMSMVIESPDSAVGMYSVCERLIDVCSGIS